MNDRSYTHGNHLPDCDRTGKLGIAVRKSRIDELPQLWNIIKGDMSFVGPRPHIQNLDLSNNKKRHTVKPGITGLGKISGLQHLSNSEELSYDHQYIDEWTKKTTKDAILLDFKILLKTIPAIIKHRSAPHSRQLRLKK